MRAAIIVFVLACLALLGSLLLVERVLHAVIGPAVPEDHVAVAVAQRHGFGDVGADRHAGRGGIMKGAGAVVQVPAELRWFAQRNRERQLMPPIPPAQ